MKSFLSLLLASIVMTMSVTACSDTASEKDAKDKTEPTVTKADDKTDTSDEKTEANKKLVTEFYQAFFGDKDTTAVDKYVADNIIQHNPLFKDGKAYLMDMARTFWGNPNVTKTKVDIKHIAAEGDMVWLMAKDVAPNGKVFARVDIFRVQDQKIAEYWSISQAVPKESENKNTMF